MGRIKGGLARLWLGGMFTIFLGFGCYFKVGRLEVGGGLEWKWFRDLCYVLVIFVKHKLVTILIRFFSFLRLHILLDLLGSCVLITSIIRSS